jgi:hypothetical protein
MVGFQFSGKLAGLSRANGAIVDVSAIKIPQKAGDYSSHSKIVHVPMIGLFEHGNFRGGSEWTFSSWKNIGEWWSDKIASLVVFAGTWELYSQADYKGDRWVLGPGYYGEVPFKIGSIRIHKREVLE